MKKCDIKVVNIIFGVLMSLSFVLGYQCEHYGEIRITSAVTYVSFILAAVAGTVATAFLWKKCGILNGSVSDASEAAKEPWKHCFVCSFAIMWLFYFIVFLGVYPGFFVYDAQYELMETITREFTNHQPIFHVLYMGGIIQGVHAVTGDYNIAIAVFTLAQMTFVSLALALVVREMNREGALRKRGCIIVSACFGVFPVLVMYALCSSKDGVFASFLLLAVLLLRRLVSNPEKFFSNKRDVIFLICSSVGMMLMRSNGVYAFIVFGIVLIALMQTKRKETLLSFVIAIVAFFIINKGLLFAVNGTEYGSREMLTVPIQQLARVYSFDEETMSEEQKSELQSFLPANALNHYNPKCSDLVKVDFNEEYYRDHSADFRKLYMSVGASHPIAYVDAWMMTSYGMHYPWATIDAYKGNEVFTFTYGDSSYFGYETEEPGYRDSKIPVIDDLYRWLSLDVTIQRIPVIRLLFSPGFLLWAFLFELGAMIYCGVWRRTLPYVLPLLVILTCFLGPVSLVRYSYYLWVLVPMIAIVDRKEE